MNTLKSTACKSKNCHFLFMLLLLITAAFTGSGARCQTTKDGKPSNQEGACKKFTCAGTVLFTGMVNSNEGASNHKSIHN